MASEAGGPRPFPGHGDELDNKKLDIPQEFLKV